MSYNRKTWTNRNVEHPYRRTLTDTTSGTSQTVDVTRAEGTITAEGDTFDANTMNNMEGRIADQFSVVDQRTGALTDLDTTDKSSLVAAINEVAQGGGGGGSSTLAGLTDTNISSPSNGQVLKYNSTSSKWENAAESGGGSSNYLVFTYTNSNNTWSFTSVVDQTGTAVLEADVYSLLSAGYDAYVDLVYPIIGGTGRALLKSIYRRGPTSFILGFGEFKQYADNDYTRGRVELTIHQNDTSSSDWTFDFSIAEYDAHYVNYDNSSHPTLSSFLDGAIDDLDDHKADLASPAFTGNPTAPTQAAGNNSTRIATTAFVQGEKPSVGSITNLTTVSANTSSWQNVGSVATAKGSKYLIVITAEFAGNSTGVRQIGISTTSGGSPIDFFRAVGANNMGTVKQQLQLVSILASSSNTTYYINVAQNSGSGLEIKSKYSLIKLA